MAKLQNNRFTREVEQIAHSHGYVCGGRTGSNHVKWVKPETGAVVITAHTPSAFCLKKIRSDFRRRDRMMAVA